MAGEQDIVSLGLNIDSFNQQKKTVLQEFIKLFDALQKYDGKIFNPVMGDGLTKFNSSLVETNKLLDEMKLKIAQINSAKVSPQSAVFDTFATSAKNAASSVDKLKTNSLLASGNIGDLGRNLTHLLTQLRYLAYILPGIGIAGIFNLAFQAVEALIDKLGLLTDSEIKQTEYTAKLQESWNEYAEALGKVFDNLEKLKDFDFNSLRKNLDIEEFMKSRGVDPVTVLDKRIEDAKTKLFDIQKKLIAGNSDFELGVVLKGGKSINDIAQAQVDALIQKQYDIEQRLLKILFERDEFNHNIANNVRVSSSKAGIERVNAELQSLNDTYANNEKVIRNYYDAVNGLKERQNEKEKLDSDQERKRLVETTQSNISVRLEEQKAILSNNKKFHDDRQKAIEEEYQQALRTAEINRINVTGTPDNVNVTATAKEREIAINKEADDRRKAQIKLNQDLERNDVEFYQRRILATTEILKDQIEVEAIAYQKFYGNEQRTLDERLSAYEDYIIKKQKIRDLEFSLEIQRDAAKPGGKTSLTPEEQQRIDVHRNTEQLNIQADAEKQTYEIVHTSLEKILKDVKDHNEAEAKVDKTAYANELNENNKRFAQKLFDYESFKKSKEQIDKKYGVIFSIDKEIEKDKESIKRLKDVYSDLIRLKGESDKKLSEQRERLSLEKESGGIDTKDTQRHVDEAKGENDAINDEIEKAQKDLNEAIKKGDEDQIKQAQAKYDQLIEFEKEYAANKKAIEEGLWDLSSKLINRDVDNKIRAIEDVRRAREENYSLEEKSIEDSSLKQKDKTALEIQLAQQKIEADKAATLEERRIKHDAAEKDRELAIAHVIWNGIESVSAALKIPPPAGELLAAQRAILAGIQLGEMLATPIPSYKEGIKATPRTELSRYGEAGPELVKEPGEQPFIADKETISVLKKGTEIIPLNDNHPVFSNSVKDESWEQTKYLAKQIKNSNKEIKNIFKPTIVVDMNFESRKRQILGN